MWIIEIEKIGWNKPKKRIKLFENKPLPLLRNSEKILENVWATVWVVKVAYPGYTKYYLKKCDEK